MSRSALAAIEAGLTAVLTAGGAYLAGIWSQLKADDFSDGASMLRRIFIFAAPCAASGG